LVPEDKEMEFILRELTPKDKRYKLPQLLCHGLISKSEQNTLIGSGSDSGGPASRKTLVRQNRKRDKQICVTDTRGEGTFESAHKLSVSKKVVIPAKAGIQYFSEDFGCRIKSGMTEKGLYNRL